MKALIGYGVVGRATHAHLLKYAHVDIYDVKNIDYIKDRHYDCVYICTPTANQQDIDALAALVRGIEPQTSHIIIRSTVPVGFCGSSLADINHKIFYCPEFLRERHWKSDSATATLVVGYDHDMSLAQQLFDWEPTVFMTTAEAEILKMMSNSYAAMRVTFANHVYDLATNIGADYQKIHEAFKVLDHKDRDYLAVNENLRGFGGKCLPKDLDFLINTMRDLQIPQQLFSAIRQDNAVWPTTVRTD